MASDKGRGSCGTQTSCHGAPLRTGDPRSGEGLPGAGRSDVCEGDWEQSSRCLALVGALGT